MANRNDVSNNVKGCREGEKRNQWELARSAARPKQPGIWTKPEDPDAEGPVYVLWDDQPLEGTVQAFAENLQYLWEAGTSLGDLQDGEISDFTCESVSSEGCDSDEGEVGFYSGCGWSERIRSMALSGLPIHESSVAKRVHKIGLQRQKTSQEEERVPGTLHVKAKDTGIAATGWRRGARR